MSIIALASNTLAGSPSTGQIEYNGQFYATDSNSSRGQLERITQGTAVSASGTSVDFTGIPAWAKKITVIFSGVSLSGTASGLIQIGSGSVETTGYLSGATIQYAGPGVEALNSTAGFAIALAQAARVIHGSVTINLIGSNIWVASGAFGFSNAAGSGAMGGSKTTSGTLDRVRITTTNGTDTFDAGTINIIYEG